VSFSTVLIANRGEIACRVIRTARAMGYRTVAVFSEADVAAPHVALADRAVRIGPAPAAESYLRAEGLIEAARKAGADAIHPGYGFLSENADFAQSCVDAGILFIGPPAGVIREMGDKARAKARMVAAGVPVVLGSDISSAEAAALVGYPVMVKAVAGGGGRGMRVVRTAEALDEAMQSAAREALSAFGDGTLMLEKLIERGRHVEIQVFADSHGNAVHMGERDCTAQRRRQKIIEESPSPIVGEKMRARMGADAVKAALAVGYRGAGTIEFIVDADQKYYFLEMNTRLQVEHPVTEFVTGLDLVEWQLRVAAGEKLPLAQEQIIFSGHAIEARLCAEDPYAGFAPQTGKVAYWRPEQKPDVRIDSGIAEGGEVSPYYDSMVAKIIAYGATRKDAVRRLTAAIDAAPLFGPVTNARFLVDLLQSPEFGAAEMHTGMIDEWAAQSAVVLARPVPAAGTVALAAAILAGPEQKFRNRGALDYGMVLETAGGAVSLQLKAEGASVTVFQGEARTTIRIISVGGEKIRFERDGVLGHAIALRAGATLHLMVDGMVNRFTEPSPFAAAEPKVDPARILATVSGTLLSILPAGSAVAAGDVVAVIEAMKIETRIEAGAAGTVGNVHAAAGQQVSAKVLLAELMLQDAGAES
jgi:geranyl-CoA carboxylase alpha subunit